jgi:hypothetical protein
VLESGAPKLTKDQYLAFNRSMMDTTRFESEVLPQRVVSQ